MLLNIFVQYKIKKNKMYLFIVALMYPCWTKYIFL